ncbi:hypothetical protein QYE76_026902 [Lolium multiflorum]|uniref:DUF4218 domain-containing protein n=1 Tax=Lolium multiflorum TaxID=4521 RepID=A0AAD8RIG9_LOLMU|nr:hypothetical protein QYE76_026902 [Lolium multiflorum]
MDAHVRETLFGLCNFFDVISRKSIGLRQLRRLQEEIVVILCELEMYYAPAFFDVMLHLLVHIVEDIIQLGPTFLDSMMPFERTNGVIKGYVRKRARPDGSIAKGFLTEECISFCTSYLEIENPVGLPVNRHLGKLARWGHREGSHEMHVDFKDRIADFERANLVALQHIDVVDPWVVEHKTFIAKTYNDQGQQRTDGDIIKEHNSTFTRWFKDKMLAYPIDKDSSAEEKLIFTLSQGAEHNLITFQAYDINGYTFYTEEKDMKSDYQNSGVTMESYTGDVKQRYYGKIEEIWELSYVEENVPMFRVRCAKSVVKEDRYFTTMVIPEAKSKIAGAKVTAKYEPWILASQVDQCFFITDPQKPSRVVVRRGKRSIIGMDGAANELDFDQYGDPKMEDDDDDEAPYTTRRSRKTLPNKGRLFKRRSQGVPGLNYSTARKKGKKIEQHLVCDLVLDLGAGEQHATHAVEQEQEKHAAPPSTGDAAAEDRRHILQVYAFFLFSANMAENGEASGSKPFWMVADEMEEMESQPRHDVEEDDMDPEYRTDGAAEDDTSDGDAEDEHTDGSERTDGSEHTDGGQPKRQRKERRPNVLSTVKQAFTEVGANESPTAPPELVKGTRHNSDKRLGRNKVHNAALMKMSTALSSWRNRVKTMILKGDSYEKIKETNPSITEQDYQDFKIKCESDSTSDSSQWGKDMRKLNLGTHKLGPGGYQVAQPKWDKEDEERARNGLPPLFSKYKDKQTRNYLRARYRMDLVTKELTTNPEVKQLEILLDKDSETSSGAGSTSSSQCAHWDNPLNRALNAYKKKDPLSTPTSAGRVPGERLSMKWSEYYKLGRKEKKDSIDDQEVRELKAQVVQIPTLVEEQVRQQVQHIVETQQRTE